jgi:hypothetical protein
MDQPELSRNLIARIAKNLKCQLLGFYQRTVVFCDLGGNGNQIGPQGVELSDVTLQSLQLKVAIRSPTTAVKDEDHKPLRQDIF